MFVIIVAVSALLFYALRDRDEAEMRRIERQQIKAQRKKMKEAKNG